MSASRRRADPQIHVSRRPGSSKAIAVASLRLPQASSTPPVIPSPLKRTAGAARAKPPGTQIPAPQACRRGATAMKTCDRPAELDATQARITWSRRRQPGQDTLRLTGRDGLTRIMQRLPHGSRRGCPEATLTASSRSRVFAHRQPVAHDVGGSSESRYRPSTRHAGVFTPRVVAPALDQHCARSCRAAKPLNEPAGGAAQQIEQSGSGGWCCTVLLDGRTPIKH